MKRTRSQASRTGETQHIALENLCLTSKKKAKHNDQSTSTIALKKTKDKGSKEPEKKPQNLYASARTMFRRTTLPSRLIGRISEREQMIQFWRDHVLENRPGCLYISGSPGTGKTALMKDVIQQMEVENSALKTHKVKVVVINCMTVREPKGIYSKLVEQLKTARQTISNDVVKQAEQLLNNKKNVINVVLLDEIDHLITKDQDVLYKIFEWASMASSRLVLIGIANALDLTDRLLPRLRAKNCEPQLLNFNPYQVSEIVAILKDRLYSVTDTPTDTSVPPPLIQPAALELCARKVAASMGDLRTALDICRHAIELAENETKTKPKALGEHNVNGTLRTNEVPKVSISHVMKVLQCVFGNPTVQKLKTLNLQQKVVIGVLMVMGRKKIQLTMGKFREQYGILCTSGAGSMITPVSRTELNDLLATLETTGVITVGKHKDERLRRIHLSVQENEIMTMIEEINILSSWMREILQTL